jgi:hypothetical protein
VTTTIEKTIDETIDEAEKKATGSVRRLRMAAARASHTAEKIAVEALHVGQRIAKKVGRHLLALLRDGQHPRRAPLARRIVRQVSQRSMGRAGRMR